MKISIAFICLVFLFSCGKKTTPTASYSKKEQIIVNEFNLIADSMNTAWRVMAKSDETKLANIKRLLEEISYTKKYNAVAHDSLVKLRDTLVTMKLQPDNMVSADIDNYDRITDVLIKRTINLMNYTPEIGEHPLAGTLQNEILAADNEVVLFRYKYDKWAKKYNAYITEKNSELNKIGPPFKDLKKRPLFQLGESK